MNRLIVIACVLLSGCASIMGGAAHPVFIDSAAGTTQFVIKNRNDVEIARGQTPMIVTLENGAGFFTKAHYLVHFSKANYKDQTYSLTASGNPWYFGNIFNFIGFFIDPATGAMWQLPDAVKVAMPSTK